MRFIPPPNSSSSFRVSAIFWDNNFDHIRRKSQRYKSMELPLEILFSISMGVPVVTGGQKIIYSVFMRLIALPRYAPISFIITGDVKFAVCMSVWHTSPPIPLNGYG